MISTQVTIVINRPLEEVFAYLSDLENNMNWRAGMIEAKKTSAGPIGVGTTYRLVNSVFGRRIESEAEVIEYVPNQRIATRNKSGPPVETTRSVEPVVEGTRATFAVKADLSGVMKVAEPLLATMAKRRVEGLAADLKDLMDAGAL